MVRISFQTVDYPIFAVFIVAVVATGLLTGRRAPDSTSVRARPWIRCTLSRTGA